MDPEKAKRLIGKKMKLRGGSIVITFKSIDFDSGRLVIECNGKGATVSIDDFKRLGRQGEEALAAYLVEHHPGLKKKEIAEAENSGITVTIESPEEGSEHEIGFPIKELKASVTGVEGKEGDYWVYWRLNPKGGTDTVLVLGLSRIGEGKQSLPLSYKLLNFFKEDQNIIEGELVAELSREDEFINQTEEQKPKEIGKSVPRKIFIKRNYIKNPEIEGISPVFGSAGGRITIKGYNFTRETTIFIGDKKLENPIHREEDGMSIIEGTIPAGSGNVTVKAQTEGNPNIAEDYFYYD